MSYLVVVVLHCCFSEQEDVVGSILLIKIILANRHSSIKTLAYTVCWKSLMNVTPLGG